MSGCKATWLPLWAGIFGLLVTFGGCFKAPDVVIVDRKTALEEQALGRHPKAEAELQQAGLSPKPAAFTRQQLERSGWRPDKEHDAIAALYADAVTDAERVDQLLVRKCIGEAIDGLLVDTRSKCTGGIDASEVAALIERVNRNRRQTWRYIAQSRRVSLSAARQAWRKIHVVGIVCGGHIQSATGWEPKKCSE